MRKISLLILLSMFMALFSAYVPEYTVHAEPLEQAGPRYYFKPGIKMFYRQCEPSDFDSSIGHCRDIQYITNICGTDTFSGAAILFDGFLSLGSAYWTNGAGNWRMAHLNTRTNEQVLSDFNTFYGSTITFASNDSVGSIGTELAYGGSIGHEMVMEFYAYCYGTATSPATNDIAERYSFIRSVHEGVVCGPEYYLPGLNWCRFAGITNKIDSGGFQYNNAVISKNECGESKKDIGYVVNSINGGVNISLATTFTSAGNVWAYDSFTTNDRMIASFTALYGTRAWNLSQNIFALVDFNPTRKLDSIYIYCFDSYEAPTIGSGNKLIDGDMEQQPVSSFWFPDSATSGGVTAFGRLDFTNLGTTGTFGSARCGSGAQLIGNNVCNWFDIDSIQRVMCSIYWNGQAKANIRQSFMWQGGKMFYRFSAKGLPDGNYDRQVNIQIWVTNQNTGSQTTLFTGGIPSGWNDYSGTTSSSLISGRYMINIVKGFGNASNDSFIVDDVAIDTAPLPPPCSPVQPATTATAMPSPTMTPYGLPGANLLENCGFEQGEAYWNWQSNRSFVIYQDNATNGNFGHSNSDAADPGISQYIYWPGGKAFVRFQSDTSYNVYFRGSYSGTIYTVLSSPKLLAGWLYQQAAIDLPSGAYYFSLHHPYGMGPSEYDNLSINPGNFGSCSAGSNATPTPIATATQQNTPTMWPTPTQRPTSTSPVGMATSTARPTYTPYPTFTPYSSPYPSITPQKWPTLTPYPTYTRQPTYTPLPTYTPDAGGTIQPSPTTSATPPPPPQQDPPDYYANCNRPLSAADIAGWQEYEKCQLLSFFSMSPNAVSTTAALPTAFSGAEPFGTFNEVKDTNDKVKALVDSYDWNNTGLPGMKDAPNPGQFMEPAADSPWVTGKFDFGKSSSTTSQQCSTSYTKVLGPLLTPPFCFLMNILKEKGILPWIQLLVNIAALGFLAIYIWRKWIDAGAGG